MLTKFVNLIWMRVFLVTTSSSDDDGVSINKVLILRGKVTPGDFSDAERYLTFY